MEIHLLYMTWITALVFTVLSYYTSNNKSFPIIAAISWVVTGVSMIHVQVIGFDTMGNGHPYTMIASTDISKLGQLGASFLFSGIGTILILMTAGWILMGENAGESY